jgi:hypothetical protein
MIEINTLGEKITQRIFGIHYKTCISKFESTSVTRGGIGISNSSTFKF